MPAAPQQGGGQGDNSMGPLWVLAAVIIFVVVIWVNFKEHIVAGFFLIKLVEIRFIQFISPSLDGIADWIRSQPPEDVNFSQIHFVAARVGEMLRWLFTPIILSMAFIVYKRAKSIGYRKTYNMTRLLKATRSNWPQTAPVIKLNLLKQDIEKGPWAMAKTPMQFAKGQRLLNVVELPWNERVLSSVPLKEVSLERRRASEYFALQLGPTWKGVERLPTHARALFAIFAALANHERKQTTQLLRIFSKQASTGNYKFSVAWGLLRRYQHSPIVKHVCSRHAYELTVMASMLEIARLDGVLSTADFIWLKQYDRKLWYMLNNVGRQTAFIESAGAFSHWLAEKTMQRKIVTPMVNHASLALELAISEVIYRDDEVEQ